MAEQDPAKQGQVCDMDPRQSADTIGKAPGGTVPVGKAPVPAPGVTLEVDLQAQIGRQLRAVYEEVVNEAVPDRFLKLLEELERKETERS